MKVLIWFLCIFANALVTTLIRESGVILGGIPAAVLFGATFWLARTLCKKWDEHKAAKAERKKLSDGEVGNGNNLPANSGWQCSCGRVHPSYETSCVCGKSKLEHKSEQSQPFAAAEVTDKICFCRKCGEKLIDGSRFCRKCGTEVVDTKNTIMDE